MSRGPWVGEFPHGTYRGARRHERRGGAADLKACPDCYVAIREYRAAIYRRRKAERAADADQAGDNRTPPS